MSRRNRVLIAIVAAYLIGFGWVMSYWLSEVGPRNREAAEASLVETAQILSSLAEEELQRGASLTSLPFDSLFRRTYAKRFDAQIFDVHKNRVELRVYVTDSTGRVVFDSTGRDLGDDYYEWRDVRRALRGEYGARTTPAVGDDESKAVMHVGVPIIGPNGAVMGALSVAKPVSDLAPFVSLAKRNIVGVSVLSSLGSLLLLTVLSGWLILPSGIVKEYFRRVRIDGHVSVRKMMTDLLLAGRVVVDEAKDALAGRSYIGNYVQTLSHELKGPLSSIRVAAELLQTPMPDEAKQRFLGNLTRDTVRIQELLDRMLELSSVEVAKRLGQTYVIDVAGLVAEVVSSLELQASVRNIRIEAGAIGAAEQVMGDPLLLKRALANLIQNAIDFSPEGEVVSVDLVSGEEHMCLRVRDYGEGVPAYAAGKVFERFYSLERPHTRKRSSGLGLTFVNEVMKLHSGRVSLRNADDGPGALATLTLRRVIYRQP